MDVRTKPKRRRISAAIREQMRRYARQRRETMEGRKASRNANNKYRHSQRGQFNAARRRWLSHDKSARIGDRLSALLRLALKKCNSESKLWKLIGVSSERFRNGIEERWKPSMTWDNFGTRWCVALGVPKRKFDLTKRREIRACFHMDNVIPTWKDEVVAKGDIYRRTFP